MPLVRVLIVDDVPYWRKFLFFILGADPSFLVVGESGDGLKAIQLAEQTCPTVVLMDVGLPGLDGIECVKRIRSVVRNVKVVFITQETDPDVVAAAFEVGASGYVLKSDAGRELENAIYSALRGETYLSRSLSPGTSATH